MTQTNTTQTIALCLILFFTALTIPVTHVTAEGNYDNDLDVLPSVYESTHAEGNHQADIIINPCVTGIYTIENGYKLDLTINTNGIGGLLNEGNYKLDLTPHKSFPEQHGISTTNIVISKTIVGLGYTVTIKVTIANQEFNHETFNVTAFANTTAIHTQTVTLPSKGITTITFTWDTTGFAKTNYTVGASATPIPSEIYTVDNTRVNGEVKVTVACDANGDGKVNILDIFNLGKSYNSSPPMPNWNSNCDFNENNNVDNSDLADLCNNYGTMDP